MGEEDRWTTSEIIRWLHDSRRRNKRAILEVVAAHPGLIQARIAEEIGRPHSRISEAFQDQRFRRLFIFDDNRCVLLSDLGHSVCQALHSLPLPTESSIGR